MDVAIDSNPIAVGDRLVLAILFTNPNVQAKPIELRLNFKVSGTTTT